MVSISDKLNFMSSAEKLRAIKSSPYLEMAICKDSFNDTDDTLNNYPHMFVTSSHYYWSFLLSSCSSPSGHVKSVPDYSNINKIFSVKLPG